MIIYKLFIQFGKKLSILILFTVFYANAQQVLTLEQCYNFAKQNHPISSKSEILANQSNWEIQSLEAQKYPKIDFEAQATYQSDVIVLPISLPNISIDSPDKDQYKTTITISQLIYNGGLIDTQKELKKLQFETQTKDVEVQLHNLKGQINQIYFSILLAQQKEEIFTKKIAQLEDKKIEIEKLISNGSTYESSVEPIQVKIFELTQSKIELDYSLKQLYHQLSLTTGISIESNTLLEIPNNTVLDENPRTELAVFDLKKQTIELQSELLKRQTFPKIMAFGTAGYGKPGLNMLNNSFDDYFLAGLKIQWNIFDFQTNKKQQMANNLNLDLIENQEAIFLWQQNNTVQNYNSEIEKIKNLILSDLQIIEYRKKIVETASKQLKHDLITSSEYTAEINNLLEAEINQKTHEIQLALAKTNYKITLYE